ncbi:MAG: hypothetical protein IH911_01865 [Proteobacteria bacterium]|nr:hypothetical protein [Pseudomonadota bacterium]
MKQQIAILILLGSLALAAAPQVNAHGYDQNRYDSAGRYRAEMLRAKQMPHWLRHDKGFRHWYRQSSLRRNYFLAWPQLLEIYRWERRYSPHRSRHEYYGYRHRDYGWYRHYWRKYDGRHRRDDYYRYH